jgi:hypothetical protein
MNRIVAISTLALLAGCSQYMTSDAERAALSQGANDKAETYLQCVREESTKVLAISRDATFIAERAKAACQAELQAFKIAESDLLTTQYIMIDTKLEEAVARLDDRSESVVAEMLLSSTAKPAVAAVAAVGAAAASSSATTTAPAVAVPSDFEPTFDQRVYMDCMRDQATRYVRLNETAAAIAEVAASRCRTHLVGSNQAVLEQEGRALVMGTVFDARLSQGATP